MYELLHLVVLTGDLKPSERKHCINCSAFYEGNGRFLYSFCMMAFMASRKGLIVEESIQGSNLDLSKIPKNCPNGFILSSDVLVRRANDII